jgi:hypothetical protein
MEAVYSSEMLNFYRITRRHIPNYSTLHTLMVFENAALREYFDIRDNKKQDHDENAK